MSDPATGRLGILLDPADDVAVTRGLLARHDPAGGRVVVHPTPTNRHLAGLAHDVLAALGAPVTTLTVERVSGVSPAWRAVWTWLLTDRVEHLVLLRAHRLGPAVWAAVAQMAARTTVRVLLVCHRRDVPARLSRELGPTRPQMFTDLATVEATYGWGTPRPTRRPPAPARALPPLPRLPKAQVLYYRADVYRRHDPRVFALVDDLYGRGLDAACHWVRHGPPPQASAERARYRLALQRFLTHLVHASPTPQHTIALLRGAQAGFLLHGTWLALPNLTGLGGPGLTSVAVTDETVARIRAGVASPVVAAGIALALFTGVDLLSLRSMLLDAVLPPTHQVHLPLRWQYVSPQQKKTYGHGGTEVPRGNATAVFHIPRAARPLLRAARTFLTMHSDDPRQRLFAGLSPVDEIITEAAARCGVLLPARPVPLIGAWQMRLGWKTLGESFHPQPPGPTRPAGQSCRTAHPPAPIPAPATRPPRQGIGHDRLGQRWSPRGGYAPTVAARLLRDWLTHPDGREPTVIPLDDTAGRPAPPQVHRGPVESHLAVAIPPTEPGHFTRYTVHPDITFALRWTDQPAPAADAEPT